MIGDAFVLGSGFSAALAGLPTVAEYREPLNDWIDKSAGRILQSTQISRQNVEALLGFLSTEQPFLQQFENTLNLGLFQQLAGWLAEDLFARQQHALGQPGPEPWMEQLVGNWDRNTNAVITLNYDTLVESAIKSVSLSNRYLSYADTYAVRIRPAHLVPTQYYEAENLDDAATLRLIKLHGSLNWYYSGASSFFGEELLDVRSVDSWNSGRRQSLREVAIRAPGRVPLIVPPLPQKSRFFENETIRALWQGARIALEQATSVYLIGYRLPEEDTQMRALLDHSVSPDVPLVPVNTDASIGDHYRRLFPRRRVVDDYCGQSDAIATFVADHVNRVNPP